MRAHRSNLKRPTISRPDRGAHEAPLFRNKREAAASLFALPDDYLDRPTT